MLLKIESLAYLATIKTPIYYTEYIPKGLKIHNQVQETDQKTVKFYMGENLPYK